MKMFHGDSYDLISCIVARDGKWWGRAFTPTSINGGLVPLPSIKSGKTYSSNYHNGH